MRKMVTLWEREDGPYGYTCTDRVAEGCEWVLDGKGEATYKWDGTACAVFDGVLYRRFTRKKQKDPPAGFIAAGSGGGKSYGWIPVLPDDPNARHHNIWMADHLVGTSGPATVRLPDGTYELVGPKIQGNVHNIAELQLKMHGELRLPDFPRNQKDIRAYFERTPMEGVVWHWRDGDVLRAS
jgi:hypothetical protein